MDVTRMMTWIITSMVISGGDVGWDVEWQSLVATF